jgi:hypothetical protein
MNAVRLYAAHAEERAPSAVDRHHWRTEGYGVFIETQFSREELTAHFGNNEIVIAHSSDFNGIRGSGYVDCWIVFDVVFFCQHPRKRKIAWVSQ